MRFRKPREEEIRLSIAPLIDIVFLLLIFFMVTSHFDVASGVRIRLPKVAKRILNQEKNKITLVIDKSGQTYLEGKSVDMKTLQKRLETLVHEKGMVQVILQADKDVRHGKVVQIMDLAKTAGAHSIIIAARWKPEKAF
ncbi:MAG: biopolymer transporter ExbD [Deltaproteobacteria bacterium]|nr:MAG: biopolymer transporter ExbD [Deltaproteobacteria bacterium]